MSRVLPILFNTDMVRAILDGRKTVTRRIVKYKYNNTEMRMRTDKYGSGLIEIQKNIEGETWGKNPDGSTWRKLLAYIEKEPPYKKGDILYVRETWAFIPCDDGDSISDRCFVYRTDYGDTEDDSFPPSMFKWRPSIHMPKQATRIWLKVTDVRVEQLQEITIDGCEEEGCWSGHNGDIFAFMALWDSTIKKADRDRYGWNANPWVWVIEFERCEKPEN